MGNFGGGATGVTDGHFDDTHLGQPQHHRHHGPPLTPSGSSPSISSSSQLIPNLCMKEDEGGKDDLDALRQHDDKLISIGSSSNGSCSSVVKRDQMGFRNLPGLPNPHVVSTVKPHRHHHRHHRVQRESLLEEREDDDEQNSLVTSSSSAFSVASPRDATWSDREVEMEDGEESENSEESDESEGESEDQITHFKPNSTVRGSTRSVNSSPGHSNQGSHYFSEGADERDAGSLQYSHEDGITAAMGFLPSPVVTSSSPNHHMGQPDHSPISPPMDGQCPDEPFTDTGHMSGAWNHGDYTHPMQDPNAVMNMRGYLDPRSQNIPGHSPVSADEYEGSEVDYRTDHGNLSDYEQNTYDNAVDERNGHEDPSEFRCMTPGSNLPLRGSSGAQQRHDEDMLESISSDAMMMMSDPMDNLNTSHDLDETGHFTAGLARATASQSFTNGVHNTASVTDGYLNTGPGQPCQDPEGFFDTNLMNFNGVGALAAADKYNDQQVLCGRSSFIEENWPNIGCEYFVTLVFICDIVHEFIAFDTFSTIHKE
ncbi:hypothetical protein Ocin01_06944 [Orchesella cincta]|uniref:Uncharacterized protein n=1 Tax=Orchesella cincta TaxID=48709 RepID=A0A1D2N395_ORCCI|nr:hypothetical protein Ocin01_06944 [Orchesella cincta]